MLPKQYEDNNQETAIKNTSDLNDCISAPQGWECPVCHAVMAPWKQGCINCTGNHGTSFKMMWEANIPEGADDPNNW